MTSSERLIYFNCKMNALGIIDFMHYINYYDKTLEEKLLELVKQIDNTNDYKR